jgi:hypothetical protein
MRKYGILVVIVLGLLAFTPGRDAVAAPVVEQDVVAGLNTADPPPRWV